MEDEMLTSVPIVVEQGETFRRLLRLLDGATPPNPLVITGWTFIGQVRDAANLSKVLVTITCTPDAINGTLEYVISHADTLKFQSNVQYNVHGDPLPQLKPDYIFDIFGVDPLQNYVKIRKGSVQVNPSATRPA